MNIGKDTHGVILVEFALVAPIMALLLATMIDVFWIGYLNAKVAQAAWAFGTGMWTDDNPGDEYGLFEIETTCFGAQIKNISFATIISTVQTGHQTTNGTPTALYTVAGSYVYSHGSYVLQPGVTPVSRITGSYPAGLSSTTSFTQTYTTVMIEMFCYYTPFCGIVPTQTLYQCYCIDYRE